MSNPAERAFEEGRAPGAVSGRAEIALVLTDRMARYITLRAQGKKPIEAGLLVGLTPTGCKVTTHKWEHDPRIVERIAEAAEAAAMEAKVTPADVIRELAVIAFSSLDDYVIEDETGDVFPVEDAPEYVMRAVQSIKRRKIVTGSGKDREVTYKTEVRLYDKLGALKMLGEYMGLWLKRIRVEEDGEVKAALSTMREIMGAALRRQQSERIEEAEIAAFQASSSTATTPSLSELANASAAAVSSPNPIDALRVLAATIQTAAKDKDSAT